MTTPDLAARLTEMETKMLGHSTRADMIARGNYSYAGLPGQFGYEVARFWEKLRALLADTRRELEQARAEVDMRQKHQASMVTAIHDKGFGYLAQIDALRARAELAEQNAADLRAERSQLTETIAHDMRIADRLRAENAGLRAALERAINMIDAQVPRYDDNESPVPDTTELLNLLVAKPAPVVGEGEQSPAVQRAMATFHAELARVKATQQPVAGE